MQTDAEAMSLAYPFSAGGGETGELIRSIDWSKTLLGSPDLWPQSLRSSLSICLNSNFPIAIYWGKEKILLYNDAWSPIPGTKHPWAMGLTAKEVWPEIWDSIGPLFEEVFTTGKPAGSKDGLLPMQRHGYTEECYFDFTFTPVYGNGGKVEGIFNAVIETTYRVINERRIRLLQQLSKNVNAATSIKEVFTSAIEAFEIDKEDIPFCHLFLLNNGEPEWMAGTGTATKNDYEKILQAETGNEKLKLSFKVAASTGAKQLLTGLGTIFKKIPDGYWPEPVQEALILPLHLADRKVLGFLMTGVSPRRALDREYSNFFETIANVVSNAINILSSLEQERKRAEALAEIDKAKTVFFSNISHEFRTPLTLMLSPLQEVKRKEKELPDDVRENIDVSYRNTLRLQKLVNTLLDFSRIEAGRMQAHYEQTDIATVTKDLASSFRSAIEKAGIQFIVECKIVDSPVYIDVDMWEKIVLNLLSNALKYTDSGQIKLLLRQEKKSIIVSVSDTGIGIEKEEQPKIFERFHRIQNLHGRSQEGSGIGLAMVQELVKLHHGTIEVKSEPGEGSTFIVSIPTGKEHLPHEKIINRQSSSINVAQVDTYVEEALKWVASTPGENEKPSANESSFKQNEPELHRAKILVADDNPDMREYLHRLLSVHYEVTVVANGRAALEKMKEQVPDLIISDVMMPEIDGFELVKKVKSNTPTSQIPIILLSARAGEEATVEGLQTGADDYLVKPFSAKRFLAVIENNLRSAEEKKFREDERKKLFEFFMQSPAAIAILEGKKHVYSLANPKYQKVFSRTEKELIGHPIREVWPEFQGQGIYEIFDHIFESGETFTAHAYPAKFMEDGAEKTGYYNFVAHPIKNNKGIVSAIMIHAFEVTEQVISLKKVEDAEERLRIAAGGTGLATWDLNLITHDIIYSPRLNELFGHAQSYTMLHNEMREQIHPDDIHPVVEKAFEEALKTGIYFYEARVVWKDGTIRWIRTHGKVIYDEDKPLRMLGTMMDITDQKKAEINLRESEERYRQLTQQLELRVAQRTKELREVNANLERSNKELEQFAYVTSHDLQEPLRKIQTFANMLSENHSTGLTERAKSFLDKMQSASQRMSKLINDLLNFSRLRQSGESFAPVDLNEILDDVRNDFELVIKQKDATIKSHHLPVIEANSLQMNQLFYNLISNALKFTKPGQPIVIEITCKKTEPGQWNGFAGIDRNKEYYELVFSDNGIGFAEEYTHKIFEIFQRLNGRSEYEGTGIGLALVKKILENHKGSVYAVSEEGKGSSFHILLPTTQANVQLQHEEH